MIKFANLYIGDVTPENVSNFKDSGNILCIFSGEYKENGPDLEELERLCKSGGAIDGASCNPLCVKNDDVCIKMTYYRRYRSLLYNEGHFGQQMGYQN